MSKRAISIIVVAVLAIGGGYALLHKNSDDTSNKSASTSPANNSSSKPAASSSTAAASSSSSPLNITVTANDTSASPDTIKAAKGQTVNLTFKVNSNGTYHGGLEFKSDNVNSGPIATGQSKTVTFTADKSFKFTPFWYQSDVQKDYFVNVNVQ